VLVTERSGSATFLVTEPATGRTWVADVERLVDPEVDLAAEPPGRSVYSDCRRKRHSKYTERTSLDDRCR
jgi:hypothetical protein